MATIGFLDSTTSPNARAEEMNAFYEGLAGTGRNGSNTMVLHAWADFDYSRLETLAQQLIDNNVGVIVAAGGPVSAIAAQNKTSTIPIVFTTITNPGAPPDGSGLVLNPLVPEANITGTHGFTTDLDDVRMKGLDKVAAPGPLGVLCNPDRPFPRNKNSAAQAAAYQAMATLLGRTAIVVNASTDAQIAAAFSPGSITGLLVSADSLFNSRRQAVLALANSLGVPAMFQWRAYAANGGLMAFGPDKNDGYRNAGEYAGRILNGEPVANLPVREAMARELFVSSQTAASMNLNPKSQLFLDAALALGIGPTINEL
jgi:putative tryptophan/tyrosine transport system substrate-binding protein